MKNQNKILKKPRYINVFLAFSLCFLVSYNFFTTQAFAQIKLRTVADWEAGSIVLLNGYKFVKLNGPGGDGYFMAMEPACDIPNNEAVEISQTSDGADGFIITVDNATGIGANCQWSITDPDGAPVTNLETTILPDADGRPTGCSISVPTLTSRTIFTATISGCNPSGDLSSSIAVEKVPVTTSEVTDEYIANMPTCGDSANDQVVNQNICVAGSEIAFCPPEATLELLDERDNKTYTFRKFPDGKLWMVDNLAYGGASAQGGTDACSNKTTFSGYSSSSPTNRFGSGTYGDCVDPSASHNSCASWGSLSGQCGYLYNWQAAMQHSSAYYDENYTGSQNNVTGLCPAGFTLPTQNDFITLDQAFGGTGETNQTTTSLISRYTNPAIYNGTFSGNSGANGNLHGQGTDGYWWSSTEYSSSGARIMELNNSSVGPPNGNFKYNGFAIRCLK